RTPPPRSSCSTRRTSRRSRPRFPSAAAERAFRSFSDPETDSGNRQATNGCRSVERIGALDIPLVAEVGLDALALRRAEAARVEDQLADAAAEGSRALVVGVLAD